MAASCAQCAGGREVDVEAGDPVEDDGVREREAEDGAGGVFEAELRRVGRGSRDDIARREEVEDAARGVGFLAEGGGEVAEGVVGGVGDDVVAGGGVVVGEAEAADHVGEPEDRLAEMAAGSVGIGVAGAGFLVDEDGGDDGLHVAADVVAVVGEDCGDARDVGRAGVLVTRCWMSCRQTKGPTLG